MANRIDYLLGSVGFIIGTIGVFGSLHPLSGLILSLLGGILFGRLFFKILIETMMGEEIK